MNSVHDDGDDDDATVHSPSRQMVQTTYLSVVTENYDLSQP